MRTTPHPQSHPTPPSPADYFPQLEDCAVRLIKAGHLYADDTPVEQMREVRCLCVGVWVDVCMRGWVRWSSWWLWWCADN